MKMGLSLEKKMKMGLDLDEETEIDAENDDEQERNRNPNQQSFIRVEEYTNTNMSMISSMLDTNAYDVDDSSFSGICPSDFSDISSGTLLRRMKLKDPCDIHASNEIKFYCNTCCIPICSECQIDCHPSVVTDSDGSGVAPHSIVKIDEAVDNFKDRLDQHQASLENQHKSHLQSNQKLVDYLQKALKNIQQQDKKMEIALNESKDKFMGYRNILTTTEQLLNLDYLKNKALAIAQPVLDLEKSLQILEEAETLQNQNQNQNQHQSLTTFKEAAARNQSTSTSVSRSASFGQDLHALDDPKVAGIEDYEGVEVDNRPGFIRTASIGSTRFEGPLTKSLFVREAMKAEHELINLVTSIINEEANNQGFLDQSLEQQAKGIDQETQTEATEMEIDNGNEDQKAQTSDSATQTEEVKLSPVNSSSTLNVISSGTSSHRNTPVPLMENSSSDTDETQKRKLDGKEIVRINVPSLKHPKSDSEDTESEFSTRKKSSLCSTSSSSLASHSARSEANSQSQENENHPKTRQKNNKTSKNSRSQESNSNSCWQVSRENSSLSGISSATHPASEAASLQAKSPPSYPDSDLTEHLDEIRNLREGSQDGSILIKAEQTYDEFMTKRSLRNVRPIKNQRSLMNYLKNVIIIILLTLLILTC